MVITSDGEIILFKILDGNNLEKQLRKPASYLTNMITSLTNIGFACLEFKDDNTILFAGSNNNQLYNFLKTFKHDLGFRVAKSAKVRYLKDKGAGWATY